MTTHIQPLRIIFMGTPEFAVPTLQALIDSPHKVVAVYSQPPRPVGRGHKIQPSPVHALAQKHNIPVQTPKSLRSEEAQGVFASYKADLAVVVTYGLILPAAILASPRLGCINIHVSLLPRWRGAAPIHHALLAGDTETGITIMQMDEGLDTGPMFKQQAFPITPTTTVPELYETLAQEGAHLLVQILAPLNEGKLKPMPQPETGACYAPKITKEMGKLDWTLPAQELERKIRALNPWPGTWFEWNSQNIKIRKAQIVQQKGQPGIVLDDQLTIACGQDALQPLEVQPPGKKAMTVLDFLNGHNVPAGTQLS
ncbi:MAG: methionyl-tRNA formyltransferase [Pseudomonadota bacterium]